METLKDIKVRLSDVNPRTYVEKTCLFCRKKCADRFTIVTEKRETLNALANLGVKYEPLPMILDYMCYQCVYRINVLVDFRRLLERNINKSRANYFYNQGDRELCRKYLANDVGKSKLSYQQEDQQLDSNQDFTTSYVISDLHHEINSDEDPNFLFDCFNDAGSDVPSNIEYQVHSPATKLLEPMFEHSESVLDTESGGNINRENEVNTANRFDTFYACKYCRKTYRRKAFLNKHQRKHSSIYRRNSSVRVVSEPIYECARCNTTFGTRARLRTHENSHKNRYKCPHCKAEFILSYDFEWHFAMCVGKMTAAEESPQETASVRRTRSQTIANASDFGDCQTLEPEDSIYSERIRNVKYWVDQADANDEMFMDEDDDRKSMFSDISGKSFATTFSRVSTATEATFLSESDFYFDGDSSVPNSKRARIEVRSEHQHKGLGPTNKLINTKASLHGRPKTRSVVDLFKKIDLELKVRQDIDRQTTTNDSRQRMKSKRLLRRLNMLTRMKGVEQEDTYYNCPICYYITTSLEKMMLHDIDEHGILPLYACKVCRVRFTRREYLQRHTLDHDAGPFTCYLCEEEFPMCHELKLHLELHAIRSHPCRLCDMSFHKEGGLIDHIRKVKHTNNKTPKKIKILKRYDYWENREADQPVSTLPLDPPPPDSSETTKNVNYTIRVLLQYCMDLERIEKYENLHWRLGTIRYFNENDINMGSMQSPGSLQPNLINSNQATMDPVHNISNGDEDDIENPPERNPSGENTGDDNESTTSSTNNSSNSSSSGNNDKKDTTIPGFNSSPLPCGSSSLDDDEREKEFSYAQEEEPPVNPDDFDLFSIYCLSPVSSRSADDENGTTFKKIHPSTNTTSRSTFGRHSLKMKHAHRKKAILPLVKPNSTENLIPSYESMFDKNGPVPAKKIKRASLPNDFDFSGRYRLPF